MIHISITEIYNYWIRYQNVNTKEIYKDKNNRHPWSIDKDLIEAERLKDIKKIESSGEFKVIGSGINFRSFTQKPLVGVLSDNGKESDEWDIMIGDKSFTNEIYNEFRGNKVRLILQVLNN